MKPNDPVVDYMPYNNKSSMYLFPCTKVEIENIVRDLSNTKSIGLDSFSMKVIKSIISNIASRPLSIIIPKTVSVCAEKVKATTTFNICNDNHFLQPTWW